MLTRLSSLLRGIISKFAISRPSSGATTTRQSPTLARGRVTRGTLEAAISAKIASIVIKGQVSRLLGANTPFGFVAQQIGAFKVNAAAITLTAGASNDTFALGKAQHVGPSPSTIPDDGFAVHVVEV